MEKRDYYLGLDLGTDSVGWAVTDTNYNLLRAKGKDLWGIREFNEALVAADRRSHRVNRRRRQRELVRIGLLKGYFSDALQSVDPLFLIRLQESMFHKEDKDRALSGNVNGIFNDKDYTDKDYYKEYPTIFHLRKELIDNKSPHDVRLVFLAILNLFKHRGHFLNATLSSEGEIRPFISVYKELLVNLQENFEINLPESINEDEILHVLGDRSLSRTRKKEQISNALSIDKKEKSKDAIIKLFCGLAVKASALIGDSFDSEEDINICFSDAGYDEKSEEIYSKVGEEWSNVIELCKEIYDIGSLSEILRGNNYLSFARVEDYNKHKKDLEILKKLFHQTSEEAFDHMFRSNNPGTYSAYVNSTNSNKKTRRNVKERKRDDLYKTIKSYAKGWNPEDPDVKYVLAEIESENFLPKQLTFANGVIPNQVHLKELKAILRNAEGYLPFLLEKDEYGNTVSNRIEQLFSFQIPYYIGPTSEKSKEMNGNGWVVRKEAGPVLPWNIDEKIDIKATSEAFIEKMVKKCSYISDEKAMPKNSLLYEKYRVLNEINNIRINDHRITTELKQDIFNDLFLSGKRVTRKKLESYLIGRGAIENAAQLSGIDININNYLSSYGKFKDIFGESIKEDSTKNMAEDIIYWCTIYGDSKKFLKERISEKYKDKLSEKQIKSIMGIKFSDWGRLSKTFLELPGTDKETGEKITLIRAMWDNNLNMMELINDTEHFTFKESLEDMVISGTKVLSEFSHEDLNDYYFSAPVKRMIWQTLSIIKELESVLGAPPKRIFIEMTRKPDDKKERKESRGKQLIDLYKNIKAEDKAWKNEMISKIESADSDGSLRSKKLYLYYTQMGRDMYTGEVIDLDELFNNNLYDIDHIYPQQLVKDDNLSNNLVLVKKQKNSEKQNVYPLDEKIRKSPKVRDLWNMLHLNNLINDEKYKRLTRNTGFDDDELAGFIARQIVETGQATKGVADLLKTLLPEPETKVVYAKASAVSEFRKDNGFLKSRLINDNHHAQDAYLNIVVGNAYYVKFTQNPINYIKKEYKDKKDSYHLGKMFKNTITRGKETAWIAAGEGEEGTIKTVKKVMSRNTPLLTRLSFVGHGQISEATLYGADTTKEKGYLPLKEKDDRFLNMAKYGGFSGISVAYFFLVEHISKKKPVRTLETVPIYIADRIESDPSALKRYCIEKLKLVDPNIRLRKIKLHSLVEKDGYFGHITGVTGNRIYFRNAVSLILPIEWNNYIKTIENSIEKKSLNDIITANKNISLYDLLTNKLSNSIFAKRPNPIGDNLQVSRDRFITLNLEEQITLLEQILHLTAIGMAKADLTSLGYSKLSGISLLNKEITKSNSFTLVYQSITGLYEKRIDLLTV